MGALPQRRQLIEQCGELLTLSRVFLPAQQQRLGIEQNIHTLGQKTGDQLRITLDPSALARRLQQRLQARVDDLVNFLNQRRCTVNRRQRCLG
ncbi:hypothetical protein D3C77_212560 [compost metagenome]